MCKLRNKASLCTSEVTDVVTVYLGPRLIALQKSKASAKLKLSQPLRAKDLLPPELLQRGAESGAGRSGPLSQMMCAF
ncbi:hypothetical protein GOP47_0019020 [Adiantum capillus-veneris]|uniref:Uncharacterized protein n=1 Tax=Adiantum capillus-veneris TaxID=13818 RepID=A0A9D4UEC1_ADICA|nr:hypothetical protein GOP47_0019020 [Adiantum capillus-veneris]